MPLTIFTVSTPSEPGTYPVTSYGALGNGADDTVAIQNAVNAAAAAGAGRVYLPKPAKSYFISDTIQVTSPNIEVVGYAPGSTAAPLITQTTYGKPIFNVTAGAVVIGEMGTQYGLTTTIPGALSAGVTSFTAANGSTISLGATYSAGTTYASGTIVTFNGLQYTSLVSSNTGNQPDISPTFWQAGGTWLVLDQPVISGGSGVLEQCQVLSVSGNTVTLVSATQFAHPSGAWVRNQAIVGGSSVMNAPPRDLACLANFVSGDGCGIRDCAVVAMVTACKFRGNPIRNDLNTADCFVQGLTTNFVQFGALFTQQSKFIAKRIRFYNATGGQTTAPGHGIYASTLTGFGGTWSSGTTYSQYQQVSFNGVQYVSLVAGNVGHQPDVSPTFWGLGRIDALAGYLSFHDNLQVEDVVAQPGFNFKDWSGIKFKVVNGGTARGLTITQAVRAIDMERCTDVRVDDYSFSQFITPNGSDSSAAAIDVLNCSQCSIGAGVVDLTQADGVSGIDMPVVLNRVSTSLNADPVNGGQNCSFTGVQAFTNYSGAFTSAAFRNTGAKYTRFLQCSLIERGGQNNYVFRFSQDTTDSGLGNTFPDGCIVMAPRIIGATHVATVDAGTGAVSPVILSFDLNLLPSGAQISDPGSGAIITNAYVANAGGTLALSPQSTSADAISISAPASSAQKLINSKNSSGNTEFSVSNSSGLKVAILSSVNGNGGFVGTGYNTTGGFPSSGNTFGGLAFVANNNTIGNAAAGVFAIAAETQNAGALGADLAFQVIPTGSTTASKPLRLFSNGDVVANATGNALATSATSGFLFAPSMAGKPSGSVTGHTGTAPLVWDSTNKQLWIGTGGSTWVNLGQDYVANTPSYQGYVEWNDPPAYTNANPGTTGQATTGNLLLCRIVAQTGGLVSNLDVGIETAGTLTAATTGSITNASNNGSGAIRITSTAHGRSTNDVLTIANVVGTTEANGAWVITVIDANTYDLNGSTFTHAYTSGGTWTLSANAGSIYDANGNFLTATGDLGSTWNSSGFKQIALATPVTLTIGSVYYVGLLFNGTAATLAFRHFGNGGMGNANLTGQKLRWSTQAATKLLASFTPSSNSSSNIVTAWVGLR